MNFIKTFTRPVVSAVLLSIISVLILTNWSYALIKEPHHILYGLLPSANNTITLQISGEIVDSYTRGDKPAAGDYFILKVPIDSVDPQLPGTYRPGTKGHLYLDDKTTSISNVTIGERGTVLRVILKGTPVDSDEDGILDGEDNCIDLANFWQDDANNDGEGDACDDNSDTDNDGYTDMQEYMNLHNGILDPEGYGFDPLVRNAPGGEGYSRHTSFLPAILLLLLDDDQD
jgi:hypothetical protein